jgi:ABC-type branched-subunit amino acid transport system permease subunit
VDLLTFALLGIGTGAVIASVSVGLVLTFRASGVVNFAQGAMASWSAYTYYSLTTDGSVPLLPLPFLPSAIETNRPLTPWSAVVVTLVVAAVLGIAVYWLVFRPLRRASSLSTIAAAVGVTLVLQTAIVIEYGFRALTLQPLVSSEPTTLAGVTLGFNRWFLLVLVILLGVALHVMFAGTRFGLAARAATEDERSAILVGTSVDRLATVTWALASVIAGFVGIIASTIAGLTPNLLSLAIIPALAAALIARFTSFGLAIATGLLIGITQSGVLYAELRVDWWPELELGTALPFLVIAICMLVAGRTLPSRGDAAAERLPRAYCPPQTPARLVAYSGLVLITAVAAIVLPFQFRAGLNNTLIGTVLALSVVVVTGFAGQVSLVQMTFAGVGAFGVATFAHEHGLPVPVSILLAVAAALVLGLVIGLPSLRARGASLAVLTLAAGVAVQDLLLTREGWFGAVGPRQIDQPTIFGIEVGTRAPFPGNGDEIPSPAFGLFLLVVTVIVAVGVMRLRRTALGAQMLTIRANERAAAAVGVDVAAVKLTSFAIGAGIAGLGGALMAFSYGSFTATPFDFLTSLSILAIAYIGGISTVGGAVWAGTLWTSGLFFVLQERIYDAGQYTGYVAGIGLVLTAVLYPEGVDGAVRASAQAAVGRLSNLLRSGRAQRRRHALGEAS